MKYLAIDNALATSGWAFFENEKLVDWGTFKTKSTDDIGKRLADIKNTVANLAWNADKVFFEDCQNQSNKNIQTYHKLSMVKGIILYVCAIECKKYECLAPSHWRSVLNKKFNVKFGRSRAEQKKKAQEFVKEHFDIEATEDECDAICLGYAGILDSQNKLDWSE